MNHLPIIFLNRYYMSVSPELIAGLVGLALASGL